MYGAGASPAPDQVDVGTGVDIDHPVVHVQGHIEDLRRVRRGVHVVAHQDVDVDVAQRVLQR